MKKLLVLCAILALASCMFAQENNRIHITHMYGLDPLAGQPASTITYNGGPILNAGGTSIYIVYYGKFTAKDTQIINFWAQNIGASQLYAINTTYFDSTFLHIPTGLNFNPTTNTFNDNYSMGKNITDAQTQAIVANAISGGHLPNDQNGVYFVLTAQDVKQSSSFGTFCGVYCGYHGPSTSIVAGETIKYSFVGNAATQCPTGCIGNAAVFGDSTSPNNDLGADGLVSIMFHELSESMTDPEVNLKTAWAGSCGENGDCCNFVFGSTKIVKNGSHANVKIGNKAFLLQEMFKLTQMQLPTDTGTCAQK